MNMFGLSVHPFEVSESFVGLWRSVAHGACTCVPALLAREHMLGSFILPGAHFRLPGSTLQVAREHELRWERASVCWEND